MEPVLKLKQNKRRKTIKNSGASFEGKKPYVQRVLRNVTQEVNTQTNCTLKIKVIDVFTYVKDQEHSIFGEKTYQMVKSDQEINQN